MDAASTRPPPPPLVRFFDVRPGEGRIALRGFAAVLLLVISAHTTMETARDTLLLTGPGPRALGVVYMGIAAVALPASALAARAGERFGQQRALAGMLGFAVVVAVTMFLVPTGPAAAIATYIMSGLLGSLLVPQFWTLVGTALTATQGRRLFGLIAAAGVVGGVLGPATATAALMVMPVKGLLLVSAFVFGVAAVAVVRMPVVERARRTEEPRRRAVAQSIRAFREQPFLWRVALVVVLSTSALLAIDYTFKSTLARTLPRAEVGPFIARYYLGLSAVSLLVQLFASGALVRRVGVAASVLITPLLLSGSAALALLAGGALVAVLLVKGVDGSLRYSIHRITEELVYLPVPQAARQRAKPLIDGALARTAQTITGASLLVLGAEGVLSPAHLLAIVLVLATAWLGAALLMRQPYLSLVRRAISSDSLDPRDSPGPIDLKTAELLVERLASTDPLEVVSAISSLVRHGREGLVPGLVLLHHDEGVLTQALDAFGASTRTDWCPLAQALLDDPREGVRFAAARALTRHERLDARLLAKDDRSRPRAYAAVHVALRSGVADVRADAGVAAVLRLEGDAGAAARLGILAAIADAPPAPSLSPLLLALCEHRALAHGEAELIALAVARQVEARAIPRLVQMLARRGGREAVRLALVGLGKAAFDAVVLALGDRSLPRRLRLHVPKTLARFGTARAADYLLAHIETEADGFVRYKSIRALGVLMSEHLFWPDRARIERICVRELTKHFRALGTLAALVSAASPAPGDRSVAMRLLSGLLEDKARHSLERAFRLLETALPRERFHHVYLASRSADSYGRASAAEFVDAVLRRPYERTLRGLLLEVIEELPPPERVARANLIVPIGAPRNRDEALARLMRDEDLTLASLAALCALESGSGALRDAFESARRARPEIDPHGHPLAAVGQEGVARA